MNLKAYGVLHPSKLPLNVDTNVVENELPEKELARVRKSSVVYNEPPVLQENIWLWTRITNRRTTCSYLMVPRDVWNKLRHGVGIGIGESERNNKKRTCKWKLYFTSKMATTTDETARAIMIPTTYQLIRLRASRSFE